MKNLLALCFCLSIFTGSSQSLTTSMTACYDLNGNATEPVNGLTGTVSVATATVDRFNNANSALHFNGSTSCFVALPETSLIKPPNALSFALWVKPESLAGGMHIVFTKNTLSSNFEAYQFEIFNGVSWRLNKANSTQNNIVLSTSTVVLNQWTHIVCTIDNTSLKLYVNGALEGTTASTFNGYDYMAGKKVYLGGTNESFNHPFIGALDNLKFWNRVITQSEVTQLYQNDPVCTVSGAPVASIVASSNSVCAGGAITFTDNSSNNPTSRTWSVTGPASQSSTLASPGFTFNTAGVYTVALNVSNSTGSASAAQTVVVHPLPTVGVVSSTNMVCPGATVVLQASGANSYSWSTTQITPSIQVNPMTSSIYTVSGTSSVGCVTTASISVLVMNCTTVGLAKGISNSSIKVFPNPVNDLLYIEGAAEGTFQLINCTGDVLMTFSAETTRLLSVDMSGYPAGMYFLQNPSGTFKTRKIVKD